MEITDQYKTLDQPCQGDYRDRGSKFIAYGIGIRNETDCQVFIENIKKEHPKARHHCFAWRLGLNKDHYRINDDGEPSGTAGRPILGQIDSFGLTNCIVVVVRYFGGTLLGTSGLINAYRQATFEALQSAKIVEKTVCDHYLLEFEYALMSEVMNTLKRLDLRIIAQDFDTNGKIEVAIPQQAVSKVLIQLKAGIAKIPDEMAENLEAIPGFTFRFTQTI